MLRQIQKLSLALGCVLALGCTRNEKTPSSKAGAGGPATARTAAVTEDGARQTSETFDVRLSPPQDLSAGATGELVLEVRALKGFHINDEYPMSFRPEPSDGGVRFAEAKYELKERSERTPCAAAEKDVCAVRSRVPLTADAAGTERVSGTLSFSVCNEDQCLIDKVTLTTTVNAR